MRIKNFYPSTFFRATGLSVREMKNLKQVVALFGVNGSGKSRLLNALQSEIRTLAHEVRMIEAQLENKANQSAEKILELQSKKARLLENISLESEPNDEVIVISPRHSAIQDPSNMQESEFRTATLQLIANPSFHDVKTNCAKFIKSLCSADMAKDYHKNIPGKAFYTAHNLIQKRNTSLFGLLKETIKEIMSKELNYYVDEFNIPIVTLDSRPLNPSELSDGQKELLAYCTFLVLQSENESEAWSLKNRILILDEVEHFLHPKAQIDLITGLRKLVGKNGQIWLASHSLAILSILDRDEIWLMENGKVKSPSIETPNMVVSSLIGEDNLDSLENFLSSQYQWASIQFALESLFPPGVVDHKEGDAQQAQALAQLTPTTGPIRLLDFGAGKGRIAQELLRNPQLLFNLFYQPLETNKDFHHDLEILTQKLQVLSEMEPSVAREILDTSDKLTEKRYQDFFDYIFMINVLHEIPLNKWHGTLNAVLGSLRKDGKLIILEDQALPRGENAHEYGFLILDIEEIQQLFSRRDKLKAHKHSDPKYFDRLTCIEVPKKGSSVTIDSIKDALQRKKINCKTGINNLRGKKTKTAKDGRINSFLTQLYANVDMALADWA